jgi:3-methyladenine DNA glycosylase AlkD
VGSEEGQKGQQVSKPPTPAAAARELLQALLAHGDAAAARQGLAFFKEPVALVGVNAATMRRLARELHQRVKADWTAAEAVAFCELMLADPRLEVKGSALVVLGRFGKHLDSDILNTARGWIEAGRCDSWAAIDALCGEVLGPLLERRPELIGRTAAWAKSKNLWLRRAAAVALVRPARRGIALDEVYAHATPLLCDPQDLVQKAVGWLLREAGKTDLVRLQVFLLANGQKCARTTLRYAIERFPEAMRQQLLHSTRPAT